MYQFDVWWAQPFNVTSERTAKWPTIKKSRKIAGHKKSNPTDFCAYTTATATIFAMLPIKYIYSYVGNISVWCSNAHAFPFSERINLIIMIFNGWCIFFSLCVLHKLYDAYGCSDASNARVWCTCVFNVPQHGLRQCLTIETRSCKILSGSALESGLLLYCMCADDIDSEKAVCQRITYKFLSQNNDDFHRSIHHVV